MKTPTTKFLGLTFLSASLEDATKDICAPLKKQGRAFHLVNAFTLTEADRLPQLQSILERDYLLCDGAPLSFILSRRNGNVTQIRGADLMRNVLRESPIYLSHFFLGSTESVLEALLTKVKRINPGINIAGSFSPPFQDDFLSSVPAWVDMLKNSKAHVIWVGLGTPKQDFVVHEIANQIPITAIAVGAAFDYIAGTLPETPKLIQKIGFEWVYRLMKEPKRLWRRYLVGNVRFIRLAVCEILKNT